ncbi:isoaspartyl peptidase/L-asparaginase [Niveibacterium umoris]|uniref:Isoaspartyl peptidase n=1 Tax=Niveibacterium umoris TaxID=1193620 RepID=A0A840BIY2_9RHOO|nr:isoaspartyl peptidase/L-asparaginase [Niveibacterium umoris]MBB4013501.1 beta-aspartyl-peptidase (threonine type) [Niveibacterium umoris]
MSFSIAIHGGAGTILRSEIQPEEEARIRAGLAHALEQGRAVLRAGGAALDAVQAAVMALEDDPCFNAGRGAVFNDAGFVELEAAAMDGATRAAGTVTGLRRVRNPVCAAREVMRRTPHVTLGFEAAERFAEACGLPLEDAAYFHTDKRWAALQQELARIAAGGDASQASEQVKHGTVGAVARDAQGRLAAATSTGGRTAKMAGRIGDTPVIGAGTWADETVAVSATGHGESFVRGALAHEISARMRLAGQSLADAAEAVVMQELGALAGTGGIIAVDRNGTIVTPFNCEGMYRAWAVDDAPPQVAIYHEEARA